MRKKVLMALLATALGTGSSLSVGAAPRYMADGAVFDVEWYLQQNPDVAAAYGSNATSEAIYQHYTVHGMKEGRAPYDVKAFDPAAVLPYTGSVPVSPGAFSALLPAISSNINAQNYSITAQPVNSYLYVNPAGTLTRVEHIGRQYVKDSVIEERVVVEDYDSGFNLRSSRDIPLELPKWGGFYAGKYYNYVIFGQDNPSEDDSLEVVRVVKYSKDWRRLGHASLRGANTTIPFRAGSLRCAEYGDFLYIRTCHQMYKSSDGRNHQANMSLAVRQSDMALTDACYLVMYATGYVSHSFNQFLLVDESSSFVTIDHGDAYPRSIVLMRYENKAGGDKFRGETKNSSIVTFPGAIGDNATGAAVGGFVETASGYVTAFSYDGKGGQGGADDRAVYLSYTSKDGLGSSVAPLTGPGMRTPVLVPLGLDGGFAMWTDTSDAFYYARYTQIGTTGPVHGVSAAEAALSDCQPILYNGEMVWYVTTNKWDSDPSCVFYRLNPVTGAIAKSVARK